MSIVDKAKDHARDAHYGQFDLAGKPYINHVETVVSLVKEMTDDEYTIAIAWLHDVIEDTEDTIIDLETQDYPKEVIKGVLQLTREKGYPYKQYISEITDERSKIVKICDLLHNQDDRRLPPEKRNLERRYKYHQAIASLVGEPDEATELLKKYNKFIEDAIKVEGG